MRAGLWFVLLAAWALPWQSVLAAESIKWPIPWTVGQQLEYETELLESETAPAGREETRTSDITTLRITQAPVDGFLQQWKSRDTRMDVIQGDEAEAAMALAAMQAFEGFPLEVELDREANYVRVRNIDAVSARARSALEPLIIAGIEAGIQSQLPGTSAGQASVARVDAAKHVGGMLDRLTAPAVMEAALGQVIQTYNAFVGVELEAGEQYELETALDSPMGGSKFPATLRFHMYASEDDPDDVFLEWDSAIDPVKGMKATWELVENLYDLKVPREQRKEMPRQISVVDAGFVLFDRRSGIIEMFESTRTTRLGDILSVSRHRMRLAGGDHDHAWAAAPVPVEGAAAP